MRKSLVRTSVLCGSLVILSGCYSNGKFHSPTWNDMAWWKKDKAPDTSLAAAPSVGRPSDEALADKNSPGAKAAAAPPFEGATASYNTPPAGAGSRYPDTAYPNTGYPDTGYGAAAAGTGGTSWSPNGNAAASVAANPYTKSGGGYDTVSRYDTGSRYDAGAGASGAAQTSPYDSNYPGGAKAYVSPSTGYDANRYGAPSANGATGGNNAATGTYDNPHYRSADPSAPAASPPYDDSRYSAPDRYAPPANTGATNDKYTAPNYAAPEDAARRYDAGGYRDMTGDRYMTDSRSAASGGSPSAAPLESRTADSRNAAPRPEANAYDPGNTGYQPAGVPSYATPTDARASTAAAPYQPGGTSRYEGPASSTAAGNANRADASAYGTNPYASEPRPENRYQEPPLNSRDGAARY